MFESVLKRDSDERMRSLRVGEVVEIRPLSEIVETLDESGCLDGMPFMPEMAAYCGQRATVFKRAHKTCDGHGNLRWLDDTVHLDGLRCDGSAHGGCQAKCVMYWKAAWLRRVDMEAPLRASSVADADQESLVAQLGPTLRTGPDGTTRYICQATQVNAASRPLPAREVRQYVWDLSSGSWGVGKFLRVMLKAVVNRYQKWSTDHLPPALRIQDGRKLHHVQGQGSRTPRRQLDLHVGETARVRPLSAIQDTLDKNNNRGLLFDAETATWCGSSGKVLDRVERIVDDRTGEMIEIKSDCIILTA